METIEGLNHIASKGEIHGDLKPENILITFQNTAVISDFGLGGITPIFCASEVFAKKGRVIKRTDTHAFAVTLLTCLYDDRDGFQLLLNPNKSCSKIQTTKAR